jgi:alpha-tubulin suppressor-like RCC1 family protein
MDASTPTPAISLPAVTQVSAGTSHTAARATDGSVWVWGSSGSGELGDGSYAARPLPVAVAWPGTATRIAAGFFHSLALDDRGSVWAWGGNTSGELGDGTQRSRLVPTAVVGLPAISAIAGGSEFSLALDATGSVWSWGQSSNGRLGKGETQSFSYPTPATITGLPTVAAIAAGSGHGLALARNGAVWAWGFNNYGQLGNGTRTDQSRPVAVQGLSNIVAIAGGSFHSLALDAQGQIWAWGNGYLGQLGTGTDSDSLIPLRITGLRNVVEISAFEHTSYARTADGQIWAWGRNELNQLGTGWQVDWNPTPAPITTVGDFASMAAGNGTLLALRRDGSVWSWGGNDHGELGDGSYAMRTVPGLAVNSTLSNILDLDPAVPNTIPGNLLPPYLLNAQRSGDVSKLSLSVDVRGLFGAAKSGAQTLKTTKNAVGNYNLYIAANAKVGGQFAWYQLNANRSWGAMQWPMSQFLSNVRLDSTADSILINILESADVSTLGGSNIYVGYGTNPDEMLQANRYRAVMTIPSQ